MQLVILVELLVPMVVAIIAYLSTDNFIVAGAVLLIYLAYFIIIFHRKVKSTSAIKKKYHQCYSFINNFIISLSVKNSLQGAYENATLHPDEDFELELRGIKHLDILEQLEYLKKYYTFHTYELFYDVIDLFVEQGGDILEMSRYLIKEARSNEEYINQCQEMNKRKIVELISLWAFTLAILVFVRYGLSQFFEPIKNQLFYPIMVGAFFLFVLVGIHIMVTYFTGLEIKGYRKYEKD